MEENRRLYSFLQIIREGLKGLMNYDTTSFMKVIEGVTSLTANSSHNLFVTTSEVTTDKGAVKKGYRSRIRFSD